MHEFPLILKHRNDPHQSIVVANADQLNSVSDEFAPDEIRKNRTEGGASVGVSMAEKSIGKAADGSQANDHRGKELVQDALATARKQLQAEADQLGKQRDEERKALDAERAELEALRRSIAQQSAALDQQRAVVNEPTTGEQVKEADKEEKIPGNRPELGQAGQNGQAKKRG